MKVFAGLAVVLVLVSGALCAHHQSLAEPPQCPDPIPGVALNITFYPNEDDCSKYWECDNGNLYNGSCGDGLVWNPNVDSCDWPYNYDCPYGKFETSLLPSAAIDCPQPPPGVSYNITFFPDETDCTKYWECDNGNLYNGTCPDDTVWNPNIDSCDWPFNYDCPYDKMGPSLMPNAAIDCPQPPPGGSYNITFYPDETDCTKYWECDNGNLYNGTCPDGTIWNPNIDSCDWSFNYDCPYDKMGRSLMPHAAIDCPQPPPGVSYNITFFPDETDCTKYWECDNGNVYNGSCPDGTIWNPNIDSCDWSFNYDCPYDKMGPSLLPSQQVINCPKPSEGEHLNVTFYPNEEDCTKYWACDNGNLLNETCTDGLIWNPILDTCDWPYNYDCPYDKKSVRAAVGFLCPPINPRTIGIVIYYPNENDVQKYWECLDGEVKERKCDNDMVWDHSVKKCVNEFL